MVDWKTKFTSRKFWACIANFIAMLLTAFKVSDSTVAQVSAIIMAGAGVVAYILGEGLIDAAREKADVYIEGAEDATDDN